MSFQREPCDTVQTESGSVLDALGKDRELVLRGDGLTKDVIETRLDYKRKSEVDVVSAQTPPHPHEFAPYFDI
jgi:glutamine synthetase